SRGGVGRPIPEIGGRRANEDSRKTLSQNQSTVDNSRPAPIPGAARGGVLRAARVRLAVAAAALILALAVLVVALGGGGPPRLPLPGIGRPARAGDPFAYVASHSGDFTARAIAGNSHVLFVKSPDGVLATARRVAA